MFRFTLIAAAILAALTIGCGDKQTADSNGHEGHDHSGHDDHDDDDGAKDDDGATETEDSSEIDEAMKGLSEADQKLARAQKDCPVTDEALGSMGVPIKVEVKGKTVFLCCAGCKKKIFRDPDKYLAKLK